MHRLRRLRRFSEQGDTPERAHIAWALAYGERLSMTLKELEAHVPIGGTPCSLYDYRTLSCSYATSPPETRERVPPPTFRVPYRPAPSFSRVNPEVDAHLHAHRPRPLRDDHG